MDEMKIAERLQGVGEYYFSKKLAEIDRLRAEGRDIISLGIGSPDQPPHPAVIEELHRAALDPRNHGYASYKGLPALLEAIAGWYGRRYGVTLDPLTEVQTLYGSKEGLIFLCQAYINKGDKVLIPNPGYPAYAAAVRLSEGECVTYDLREADGWMPDFEAIERMPELSQVKMMILNYPHMPTGTPPAERLFERFVAFARQHGILLVHDNPYSFVRNDRPQSLLAVPGAREVAVELNSLSKSHNMAGWRIATMVGRRDVLDIVLRYKSNLNNAPFIPLQRAAVVALGLGDEWYAQMNAAYREREPLAVELLQALGCRVAPGQMGLFEWGALPSGAPDCYEFIDRVLYDKNVFVTPGGIFGSGGERYIRVSLCADTVTLEQALERIKV